MPTRLADGLGLEVPYERLLRESCFRFAPGRCLLSDLWFPRAARHARLRHTASADTLIDPPYTTGKFVKLSKKSDSQTQISNFKSQISNFKSQSQISNFKSQISNLKSLKSQI